MVLLVKCCENCVEYIEGECKGLLWPKHDACYWFECRPETIYEQIMAGKFWIEYE